MRKSKTRKAELKASVAAGEGGERAAARVCGSPLCNTLAREGEGRRKGL